MSNFKHSFFRTLLYAQLLSGFSGVAIAAQISLSVKDRPMREVIKELEETTEYRFFYNDGIKGLNSPISVDVEDADINAVMDAIAKQANVAYVLKSGHPRKYPEKHQRKNVQLVNFPPFFLAQE